MHSYLKDILDLLGEHKKSLPMLFMLFIFSASFDLLGLSLIAPYISLVTTQETISGLKIPQFFEVWLPINGLSIYLIGLLLVIVFFGKLLAALFVNYKIHRVAGAIDASLRTAFLNRFQNMEYDDWLQRNTSEYVAAINTQVPMFNNLIISNGLRAFSDGVVAILVMVFLAYTDWRAFLVIGCMMGGTAFVYDKLIKAPMKKIGARQRELVVTMTTTVRHAMEGLKELRVLGVESYFNKQLRDEAREWTTGYAKAQTVTRMPRYISEFSLVVFVVLLVNATAYIEGNTQNLVAVLSVFALGAMRLVPAVSSLMAFAGQLRLQRNLVQHLANDWRKLQITPRQNTFLNTENTWKFEELDAQGVYYRYSNAKEYALINVDLKLLAGDSIALIGTSGSGKTTLVDVLLGLLKPEKGSVNVNGIDVHAHPHKLLSQVAYLPQHIFLVDDTLRKNIALGVAESEIDEEKVVQALIQAQLKDLVGDLPMGLDTVVGDRGLRLSGGQRQRVSLARAFYYGKSIIVLDEATSALDHKTEQEIVKEVNLLKGKVTLIVIAHRLSTVKGCERIYKLEKGKIVKHGAFDEVVQEKLIHSE
jgi:ATP-binding cassette, subfamily B, bacterial PglK